MFNIGRIVKKICGRDGGKFGVVIDVIDRDYVLIDGEVRRRRCNVTHLLPLDKKIKIKKNAKHEEVIKVLKKVVKIKEVKKRYGKRKTSKGKVFRIAKSGTRSEKNSKSISNSRTRKS